MSLCVCRRRFVKWTLSHLLPRTIFYCFAVQCWVDLIHINWIHRIATRRFHFFCSICTRQYCAQKPYGFHCRCQTVFVVCMMRRAIHKSERTNLFVSVFLFGSNSNSWWVILTKWNSRCCNVIHAIYINDRAPKCYTYLSSNVRE